MQSLYSYARPQVLLPWRPSHAAALSCPYLPIPMDPNAPSNHWSPYPCLCWPSHTPALLCPYLPMHVHVHTPTWECSGTATPCTPMPLHCAVPARPHPTPMDLHPQTSASPYLCSQCCRTALPLHCHIGVWECPRVGMQGNRNPCTPTPLHFPVPAFSYPIDLHSNTSSLPYLCIPMSMLALLCRRTPTRLHGSAGALHSLHSLAPALPYPCTPMSPYTPTPMDLHP